MYVFAGAPNVRPFGMASVHAPMGHYLPYMRVLYFEAQVSLFIKIESVYFDLPKTTASLM